ncbi:MAG: coiled-coil protein [Candidatus Heimdallarchaeaceae archaeon]
MSNTIDDQDPTENIVVTLGKLEEDINKLKNTRNDYNLRTKEVLTKRNEINKEIQELLDKAKDCMQKRDHLNQQVKDKKLNRKNLQEILQQDKKTLEEIVEKEQSTDKGSIRKKRGVMIGLNKRIEKIEWELQTSVLKPEQEKEIIQILEKLSEQANRLAEEVHITSKQTELWKKIASAQKEINIFHVQIVDAAKESQIFHNLMNQHFQKVNTLRKTANEHHKEFIINKKAADGYHKDFLSKVTKKNELRKELKGAQQEHRRKIKDRIKANIAKGVTKAFEKYEAGENLSLDEFRLLVENGMI